VCVLALPGKEKQQTCAAHSYNTLWCVFHAVCVLALPGKENSRPVQLILTTPFGVFLMPCVFSLHRLVKEQQTLHLNLDQLLQGHFNVFTSVASPFGAAVLR
jgi:hypothetical protein